ncbi:hypothetical protein BDV93DRAFT_512550 [Ceratobasidium sp. AG-I]|nr:hypothetical protein BDV93DRAFT_512550 [Ceratobasidium sp. AG-I]
MYAQKVQVDESSDDTTSNRQTTWNGLPVAWTIQVYTVYRTPLACHLLRAHSSHQGMCELIRSVARMEQFGPIHNFAGLSDNKDTANIHIPHSGQQSLSKVLSPAELLPTPFFNPFHDDAPLWSLQTFQNWVQPTSPHIHTKSGTVFGGPFGVRNLVFAISRVLQTLERIRERNNVPKALNESVFGPRATWSLQQLQHLITLCIQDLSRQVLRSTSILQITFPERALGFEREVQRRVEHLTRLPYDTIPQELGGALGLSNGVPVNEIDASLEASRVVELLPKKRTRPAATMSPIGDESLEEVQIPRDSDISGTSNDDEPIGNLLKDGRKRGPALKRPSPDQKPTFYGSTRLQHGLQSAMNGNLLLTNWADTTNQ